MDRSIDVDLYLATMGGTIQSEAMLDRASAAYLLQRLTQQTHAIQRQPYQPEYWIDRASTLRSLHYAELALGDLWKAELCIDNVDCGRAMLHGFRLGYQCGFWMSNDSQSIESESMQVNELDTLRQDIGDLRSRLCPQDKSGLPAFEYTPRPYPWLDAQHCERGQSILDDIQTELCKTQPLSQAGQPFCEVRRGAHENAETSSRGCDALGLFACTLIERNTVIIRDDSDLYGMLGNKAKERRYNGHDLEHVLSLPFEVIQETLVRIKCLLTAVDTKADHPLELPAVARLKPSYHNKRAQKHDLASAIVAPNTALLGAGIDILADARYDTWVLFTIEARLANNIWSQPNGSCLAPLFAMLNHSCAPNCRWQIVHGVRPCTEVSTLRDIQPGEQLYVAYNEYILDEPVGRRQQVMSRWIDGGCRCARCEDELRLYKGCNLERGPGWKSAIVLDQTVLW